MANLASQTVVEVLCTSPANVRAGQLAIEVLYQTIIPVAPPVYQENIHTYMLESTVNK